MLTSGRIGKTSVLSHLKDSALAGTWGIGDRKMQGLEVVCPEKRRTRQNTEERGEAGNPSRVMIRRGRGVSGRRKQLLRKR